MKAVSMNQRTRMALVAGFGVFVVGVGGAAYLANRQEPKAPAAEVVTVLRSVTAVDLGTSADSALSQGMIQARSVTPVERPPDAVGDPSTLAGLVAVRSIPVGTIVTTSMFASPQTRIGSVVIPAGMRAVTLELSPVPGVSGFVGAGDRIDVYAVANGQSTPPAVRLVLQGVEVLNVNGTGLPTAQGQPGSANLVYLLAVTPVDAERLIYLYNYEKLHFDLVPKGEGPVATPGAGPGTVFVPAPVPAS